MRITPIDRIILEGPDLAGKSTFFKMIHKKTNYSWVISDRSALSSIVYARLNGRDEYFHIEAFKKEINNLNNVVIILLPDWNVIAERFQKRGDEIQNIVSLKKVYDLFLEAVNEFENYPNVITIRREVDENLVSYIVHGLKSHFSVLPFHEHSKAFKNAANCNSSLERIGLSLTHYDDGMFDDISEEMLRYEKEKVYYNKIRKKLIKKIDSELAGINEYNRIETHESRRFIYTDNSCLSLCHFLLRNEFLYGEFYLRSSNTKETLSYDMNFIKSLMRDVYSKLSEYSDIKMCKIDLKIGSSHIVNS